MQLIKLNEILMLGNDSSDLKEVILAVFKFNCDYFANSSSKKANNSKASALLTDIYALNQFISLKIADKASIFINNHLSSALNTATVYINGSNCDSIKPASAYRLHPGLMRFSTIQPGENRTDN